MNKKRFILSCLAVFVFVFLFDWIFHQKIMMQSYIATASLWRPQAEMGQHCWWILMAQILGSVIFCYIFLKGYENKGIGEGLRYGLLIAILFVPHHLIMYAVQPFPGDLILKWIAGDFVEGALAGMILAAVYRPRIS